MDAKDRVIAKVRELRRQQMKVAELWLKLANGKDSSLTTVLHSEVQRVNALEDEIDALLKEFPNEESQAVPQGSGSHAQ